MDGKTKGNKARLAFRIIFLTLFILECIVLCIESLLPAKASSQQSGTVGGVIDGIMTDLGGDGIKDVPPVSITALCGGRRMASLGLGASVKLSVQYEPSNTSVNYRDVVWSSDHDEVAKIRGGKLYAVGPGTATITATLKGRELSSSVTVTVQEVIPTELSLFFESGEDEATLEEGECALLSYKATPETELELAFSSSDEDVASVGKDGLVRAVREGTATISAVYTSKTLQDGEPVTLTAQVTVTVTPRSGLAILPESLEIGLPASAENNILYAGDEDTFISKILPADCTETELTWKSSDPKVLSVEAASGGFHALKKGKATVTASACGGLKRSIEIEVRNSSLGATIGADGAKLSSEGVYTLTVTAGKEIPLAVSAKPAEYYVRYSSGDADVLDISETGTLLPCRAKDEVRVTVTVSDDPDFSGKDGALTETLTVLLKIQKQKYSDGVNSFSKLVRKLFGHFGAFFLLGLLAAGTAISFDRGNWKWRLVFLILFLAVGFLFAGLTEILQLDLFTSGRGASIRDVGIDYSGFVPAFLLVYGVFLLVKFLLSLKKKKDPPKALE